MQQNKLCSAFDSNSTYCGSFISSSDKEVFAESQSSITGAKIIIHVSNNFIVYYELLIEVLRSLSDSLFWCLLCS